MSHYQAYVIRFTLILFCYILSACSPPDFQSYADKRHRYAKEKNDDNIVVAVFNTSTNKDYTSGITLAVDEINKSKKKLLGKEVEIISYDSDESYEDLYSNIINVVKNPQVIASLGHFSSTVAVPASIVYEKSHVLFFSPFATSSELTRYQFQYVFRMLPNDNQMVRQIISAMTSLGYENIALLSSFEKHHKELSYLFKKSIEDANEEMIQNGDDKQFNIIYNRSFFSYHTDKFSKLVATLNNIKADAIFLSSTREATKQLIKEIRRTGLNTPIVLVDNLISTDFTEADKDNDNNDDNLVIKNLLRVYLYDDSSETIQNRQFIQKYQKQYAKHPNEAAAQGYDAIRLLASSVRNTQSTDPLVLATHLHNLPFWIGATGIHSFTQYGDLIGRKYFFQTLLNEKWYLFNNLEKRYFLDKTKELFESQNEKENIKLQEKTPFDLSNLESTFELTYLIFNFKTLGIIHDKDNKSDQNYYKIIKQLSEEKNITIKECHIAFSSLSLKNTQEQLMRCYAILAPFIDILSVHHYKNTSKENIETFNKILLDFGVPTFQIRQGSNRPGQKKPNSTLLISNTKDKLNNSYIQCLPNHNCDILSKLDESKLKVLLKGMLKKDMDVNAFIEKSNQTKVISLDLKKLIKIGFSINHVLLATTPNTLGE